MSHSLSGLKKKGPITTDEIEVAGNCLIRRVQRDVSEQTEAPGWQLVKVEDNGIFLCKKRISGYQPIYVDASPFVEKLIEYTHEKIMHLGVANTMAAIRKQYWVPHLRSKVKKPMPYVKSLFHQTISSTDDSTFARIQNRRIEITG